MDRLRASSCAGNTRITFTCKLARPESDKLVNWGNRPVGSFLPRGYNTTEGRDARCGERPSSQCCAILPHSHGKLHQFVQLRESLSRVFNFLWRWVQRWLLVSQCLSEPVEQQSSLDMQAEDVEYVSAITPLSPAVDSSQFLTKPK